MFSFFEDGITQTIPSQSIQLQRLVQKTLNNPQIELINEIRALRRAGNNNFKIKKRDLANITPGCIVKERSLLGENFSLNFLCSTGYVFIDFDFEDIENVNERKKSFIEKYGELIAFCCVSASTGGLSVMVRVDASIESAEQYTAIWIHLTSNVFTEFIADKSTKDIGRAMYISSDPDVYVNYESIVDLKSVQLNPYGGEGISKNKKEKKTDRSTVRKEKKHQECTSNLLNSDNDYSSLEKKNNIIYRTPIVVKNPIVEIEEREYVEIFFSKEIPDGMKHKTYINIIYKLLRLNPGISKDDLRYEMYSINNRQKSQMTTRRLNELIEYYFSEYHSPGFVFDVSTKNIHFHKDCGLTLHQKRCVSSEINARIRMNRSIRAIQEARALLESLGENVSKMNVAKYSNLSRSTVHKYFNMDEVDLKDVERHFNEKEIAYPSHPDPERKGRTSRKKREGRSHS
jgi:hypothetical protein